MTTWAHLLRSHEVSRLCAKSTTCAIDAALSGAEASVAAGDGEYVAAVVASARCLTAGLASAFWGRVARMLDSVEIDGGAPSTERVVTIHRPRDPRAN